MYNRVIVKGRSFMSDLTIKKLQAYIKSKDFDPSRKPDYFYKLVEEVGEVARQMHDERRMESDGIKGTLEEELYDVLYYVLALANLYDIDIQTCALLKEEMNQKKYNNSISLADFELAE